MGYEKQDFVNGQVLTSEHMNHIEDGIQATEELAASKAKILTAQVTLYADDWIEGTAITQTVTVEGATSGNVVWVAAAPETHKEFHRAGIQCTAQGEGTLTFSAQRIPAADVLANLSFFE